MCPISDDGLERIHVAERAIEDRTSHGNVLRWLSCAHQMCRVPCNGVLSKGQRKLILEGSVRVITRSRRYNSWKTLGLTKDGELDAKGFVSCQRRVLGKRINTEIPRPELSSHL